MIKQVSIRNRSGAASLEAVVAMPILFAIVFAGLLFGYYIFVKLVLSWFTYTQAEALAQLPPIQAAAVSLNNGTGNHAGGVVHFLSGYDPNARPTVLSQNFKGTGYAIPIPGYDFAIYVACYPLPFKLPDFLAIYRGAGNQTTQSPPAQGWLDQLKRLIDEANATAVQAGQLMDKVEEGVDAVRLIGDMAGALTSGNKDRVRQTVKMVVGMTAETLWANSECSPKNGSWVVSTRAVVWSEQTHSLFH